MALSLTVAARNAILNAGLNTLFDGGTMEIRSGARPASASAAPTGTLLASISLGADSFAAASGGSISKAGTWQDSSADGTGTASWVRFKASGDTGAATENESRIDADVVMSPSSGDVVLDNTSIASGQVVTVNSFSFTLPAA